MFIHSAARGLGNMMARACIEAGAKNLIIFDANPELGTYSAAELHKATGSTIPVEFFPIDVRDATAIEQAVAAITEKYGAPDVLINSAGIAE
jgi:NAD(P)-dependent dehydrogenase (short-subunit alcohol dehydrogenase family)